MWKCRQSRFTDCESLPCTLQASNFLHFSVSANSTRSFHSCRTELRVKSNENAESVAVVNCCHILMGLLCEVVLRYALKLQVWNITSTCEVWDCSNGSALVARRLRYVTACRLVSLGISSKLCVSGSNSPRIISLALVHACRWRRERLPRCPEPLNRTTRRQKQKTNLKHDDAACDTYLLFSELLLMCAFSCL